MIRSNLIGIVTIGVLAIAPATLYGIADEAAGQSKGAAAAKDDSAASAQNAGSESPNEADAQPASAGNRQGGQQQQQPRGADQKQAQISPEAQQVLAKVRDAYSKLNSLKLEGKISSDIDVAGQQQKSEQQFKGAFEAPNKFRHQVEDDLVVGSTGSNVFAFSTAANSFLLADAPNERAPAQDLPRPIPGLLAAQNPSLLLAIEKNPLEDITRGATQIDKLPDVKIGDKSFTALGLQAGPSQPQLTLAIDPQTHLIRRITADMQPALKESGAADVKQAKFVIDYTTITPGAKFEKNHFAWSAPAGAQDVAAARPAAEKSAQANLVGKPAPDFKLDSLNGKSVSLSDFKGQVVLLDFWASWCPPCQESLPHLGQVYGEKNDGVKVLAVNMGEQREAVQAFVKQQNIDVPVLLDPKNQVAQKYNVSSIPQSVIIGKDGQVKKVFVGMGPDTFKQIRQEIQSLQGDGSATTASEKQPGTTPQEQSNSDAQSPAKQQSNEQGGEAQQQQQQQRGGSN